MSKKYSYEITTQEIIPPLLHKYKYVGIVMILVKITEEDKKNEVIKTNFEEVYGETKEEAYEKIKKKVEEWIASQS